MTPSLSKWIQIVIVLLQRFLFVSVGEHILIVVGKRIFRFIITVVVIVERILPLLIGQIVRYRGRWFPWTAERRHLRAFILT